MELSFLSSPQIFLTVFTLAVSVFLYIFIYHQTNRQKTNHPPGNFGWPIIGETYQFLYGNSEKFIGDRMKKYSPKVFKTKVYGEPTAVLCGVAGHKFITCGVAGHKFITANEEKLFRVWRPHSLQKLSRAPFLPNATASIPRETMVNVTRAPGFIKTEALIGYLGKMDTMIQQHFNLHWEGKQKVQAYELMHRMTATLSSRFFLGLEENDPRIKKFARLSDGMTVGLHSFPINIPGTVFYHTKKAAEAMRKEVQQLIKEKKAVMSSGIQTHDILSHMIFSSNPAVGRFKSEKEIASLSSALVVSGFTTPATALAIIMKYLAERPDIYDKIRAGVLDRDYHKQEPGMLSRTRKVFSDEV
ncbi:beta-amyrin 28-monooxygenase-like [Cornus florida]|uniref:beta-amyrin 28-monooxygenase-like n=1 Tax=Cornus florida TaxID=4283 RepID=UPI0028A18D25|nr:beta-amyrin 28-monooxygenase-like [Cornus florida]